jgi:hypothetical protein
VPPSSGSRLLNLSTRALCGDGSDVLIPGFVAAGTGSKQLLVRAVGPRLSDLGVGNVLPDPRMVIKRLAGESWIEVGANDDWSMASNAAQIAATSARVGAFSLLDGSRDAAMLLTVQAGAYSVLAQGAGGQSGVALVELFDADEGADGLRLTNLSNRGYVGTGGSVMIPGFIVSGDHGARLLLRAVGPGLSRWISTGLLTDPQLRVYRRLSGSPPVEQLILSNDNWGENADGAEIESVGRQVGAFSLPAGSADSAMVVTLPSGAYTLHASGVADGTGIALVELYLMP